MSAKNHNAYTWNVNVEINSNSEISFIKSPSHPDISISYENEKKTVAKCKFNPDFK